MNRCKNNIKKAYYGTSRYHFIQCRKKAVEDGYCKDCADDLRKCREMKLEKEYYGSKNHPVYQRSRN